jgi:hypothetical protein
MPFKEIFPVYIKNRTKMKSYLLLKQVVRMLSYQLHLKA